MHQKVTHPNDEFVEGWMADLVDLEDTKQWSKSMVRGGGRMGRFRCSV